MATMERPTATTRQSVKVSERTGKLLRLLAALDERSQTEIADKAIEQYVDERKKSLKGRLSEVQKLLDKGGQPAVARDWGKKVAGRRAR